MRMLSYKISKFLRKNSNLILTSASVIGTVSLVGSVRQDTKRAIDRLDNKDYTELSELKHTWDCYIPSAIIASITIGCICSNYAINKNTQKSLVAAYALLHSHYKTYREAVEETCDEDQIRNINSIVANKMYIRGGNTGTLLYDPDVDESENMLFYDDMSGRYFQSKLTAVISAQYHINRNFSMRGSATQNELYDMLGLPKISGGNDVGWELDTMFEETENYWIDFENELIELEDGMVCTRIVPHIRPNLMIDE